METDIIRHKEEGTSAESKWAIFDLPERVDAFNYKQFTDELSTSVDEQGPWLALNFSDTSFLSLVAIKFISECADKLKNNGGGMAVVNPTEKLKRQISIYATLDNVNVYPSFDRLLNV